MSFYQCCLHRWHTVAAQMPTNPQWGHIWLIRKSFHHHNIHKSLLLVQNYKAKTECWTPDKWQISQKLWCQDRKSFITEKKKKKKLLPKYRNLYNFRTINLHELYKFTAVHHNIPKEKKLNTIKMYWHEITRYSFSSWVSSRFFCLFSGFICK